MFTDHVDGSLSGAGNDHRGGVAARSGSRRIVLAAAAAVALLGGPSLALAQAINVPSQAEAVPLHSRVTVSTLPPPAAPGTPAIKPFRTRDPERLRSWKDKLRGNPGAVLPTPGFVLDSRSRR